MDRHVIHHRKPVIIPELCQKVQLPQVLEMLVNLLTPCLSPGDFSDHISFLCLGLIKPRLQGRNLLLIGCLVKGNPCIFMDTVIYEAAYHVELRLYLSQLPLQRISRQLWSHVRFKHGDQLLPLRDGDIGSLQEKPFNLVLCERRRGAFFAVKLVIALPDDPTILICGVPHL